MALGIAVWREDHEEKQRLKPGPGLCLAALDSQQHAQFRAAARQARDPESIREHARRVGMPGEEFYKVATTVVVRDDPAETSAAA